MHQILFRLGELTAGFKGPSSKRREGTGGKGIGGERKGENVDFHHIPLSNLTTGLRQ